MDINDVQAAGEMPDDIWGVSVPANEKAKASAEEESRVKTVKELLADSQQRAVTVESKDKAIITSSHFGIDDVTGGIQREFVWVIGADTSWGKSSLAVAIADENIKLGNRVLIVPVEDSDRLYADRLMVRRARVPLREFKGHRIGRSRLSAEHQSSIARVAANAEECPVYLDGRGKRVEWIASKVKKMIKDECVDLVMFDYLQAFDNEKPQADRRNQLNYIARTLTDVVKTQGAAGVIFSQITVSDKQQTPDRHSIRDSRDVTNAAEVVALGFHAIKDIIGRDGIAKAHEGDKVIFIDKNKDGPPKQIFGTSWHEDFACFDTVSDPAKDYEKDFGALDVPEYLR